MRDAVTIACTIALALAVVMPPERVARADAPKANDARADELFRDGVQKFDAGHVNEACEAFTESLRLDSKLGTLLNLAVCHENQGKLATAWSEYSHGAAWATQQGQKDRREFANQHALALEIRLSRVLLKLPPKHNLLQIDIDGEPLPISRWFLPIFLNPGEHAITVSSAEKTSEPIPFVVAEGPSAQTLTLPLLEGVGGAPASPIRGRVNVPKEEPQKSPQRIIGYAIGGAGLAALAVGSIAGLVTLSRRDEIGANCAGNNCDAVGLTAYESAQSSATVATVGFVLGLIGVGVGTGLVLTAPHSSTPRSAQLAPIGTPGGGGLGIKAVW